MFILSVLCRLRSTTIVNLHISNIETRYLVGVPSTLLFESLAFRSHIQELGRLQKSERLSLDPGGLNYSTNSTVLATKTPTFCPLKPRIDAELLELLAPLGCLRICLDNLILRELEEWRPVTPCLRDEELHSKVLSMI
jgi:hypothetical protein